MNIKSLFVTTLAVAFSYVSAFAQNQPSMPISPEAASLAKMVNYPVSLNTGVPDISVPLYQIQAGGMNLPIAINYHAGGFKINEMSTSVGLGWSLSTDIQIIRTINGLDDFAPSVGYIANTKIKSSSSYPMWENNGFVGKNAYDIATGAVDGAPDKFSYKLLNKSGSFYFQKNSNGSGYVIVPVPFDNLMISYNNGQFTIIDTDGTTYVFGSQGSTNLGTHAADAKELTGGISSPGGSCVDCRITAWKCKTIDNPTKTDQVVFTYQNKSDIKYKNINESIEYFVNENPCGLNNYWGGDDIPSGINSYEALLTTYPFYNLSTPKYIERFSDRAPIFHLPYLNSSNQFEDKPFTMNPVTVPTTTVAGLALSRIDFRGGSVVFTGADKLQTIKIQDANNTEIKTFTFFQSYVNSVYVDEAKAVNGPDWLGTMYLDSIQTKNSSIVYDRHKFLYNDKFCFGNHLKGKDAWGYPNQSTSERFVSQSEINVPQQNIFIRYYKSIVGGCTDYVNNVLLNIGSSSNTESPDKARALSGVLKRIIYPTGGYVDFDFESNKYVQSTTNFNAVRMGGGLRIRSINYFDGKEILPVKQTYYKYGTLEDGIGILMNTPDRQFFNGQQLQYDAYSFSQNIGYITGPNNPNAGDNFDPVPINCYNRGCLTLRFKEKKTTYMPASSISYSYPNGAPIYYTKVTEYNQELGQSTGKRVHYFYEPNYFTPFPFSSAAKIPNTNIDILQTDGLMGVEYYVEDYKTENGKFRLAYTKHSEYTKYVKPDLVKVVYSFMNNIYTTVGGTFSGTNEDLYNTNYSFTTGISMDDDFIAGEYGIQVGKLLLDSEDEAWHTDGSTIVSKLTEYKYDNASYVQPTAIKITNNKDQVITKTLKHCYDFAGITVYDQMEANNMRSQLIEEVEVNTTLSKEISRTKINYGSIPAGFGFIAPSYVQKSFGGGALETIISYDLYDHYANILQTTEKNNLVRAYVWGYNYTYPVAEIVGMPYSTATASLSISALQTYNPSQLKTTFDNLRTSLTAGMITSYTHQPLIGVLSETKANGLSTNYEYDGLGRLKTIKNYQGEIVKQYDYHITGPTLALANVPYYVNEPKIGSFYNTCPSLNIRPYNFVVAGGKHWSYDSPFAADYAAENELEANGPYFSGVDCGVTENLVKINLISAHYLGNPVPNDVYIDIVDEGTVIATRKFSSATREIYVPASYYTISLRQDDNFNGSGIICYVGPVGTSATLTKSGASYNFQYGTTYEITVSNSVF